MRWPPTGVKATPRSTAVSRVRLTSRSSGTPASIRLATTARAAPPAPSTTTGPVSAIQCGALYFNASRNPNASVLRPSSVPSGCFTTVFTAPMRRATASMRSRKGMISILCGSVRLQPRALGVERRKSASVPSAAAFGSTGRRP